MLRISRWIAVPSALACAAGLLFGGVSPARAGLLRQADCAPVAAEMTALNQRISAHNAAPPSRTDAAAVAAYNARAGKLNARRSAVIARLRACLRAFDTMRRNHPLGRVPTPSKSDLRTIEAAVKRLSETERRVGSRWNPETYDFLQYGRGKPGMIKRVDRKPVKLPASINAVYRALDATRPAMPRTAYLQGVRAPAVGSPDPAYPGRTIKSVAFDHIVPLRRLVAFRGFLKLTPRNMYLVANSPANSQWLSGAANSSKQSGSSYFVSGASPAWLRDQARLRDKTAQELQDLVKALLKSQKA
ncbi:hypothetical protein OUY22_28910 [Nonomuraea sp. MCN248]|uniref:HNH endonuclease n=1 Tax=Nonomuraea corallina TaxID=2989783 RepID=A0ABT4SKH1_9ACTN|nr:hypothetical protein [Nonomuraea corallina]MDA0637445.1 hypothetical protein [Nonomuraea corallina]